MAHYAEAHSGRILRRPEVEAKTGLPKSTIYAGMSAGTFPKPVPLGARSVGWLESEITAWKQKCVAAREARRSGGKRQRSR